MIDLYYWTTPNGHKITMFLEESGLPYTIHPINIGQGDQFKPEFLRISPNNRMPAIVDTAPADGGRRPLDARVSPRRGWVTQGLQPLAPAVRENSSGAGGERRVREGDDDGEHRG